MKFIKSTGLVLFLIGLAVFTALIFTGDYKVSSETFNTFVEEQGIKSEQYIQYVKENVIEKEFDSQFQLSHQLIEQLENANAIHKENEEWDKVIWNKPHNISYDLIKQSASGVVYENQGLFWWLTFGLGIIGALLFILPNVILLGGPGIKNDRIYHSAATNRGWIGIITFIYLVSFYILLYFRPDYVVDMTFVVNPISLALNGNPASQWFLYGFMYTVVMVVMGIRMYIKYRHSRYHIIRTSSVLFFQISFAFMIPEIMVRFNKPHYDFKNAFPLDYSFFFDWNLDNLASSGYIGLFILVWGVLLSLVIVPVLSYFYGKRWYCSWVCGCGGLAETLGDPYRHLSNKKVYAWKIERWLIHGVLVLILLLTVYSLYYYFTGVDTLLGIKTKDFEYYYGFLIGSIFAGVVGTGFYPILGNRVWCRFGCPLAAYMGLVQRFKSRFRITTNGGQCISCGNCSVYCEQGIDVRAYAQKGENIVRASCVGCGICSSVCPRGVLKLENGPEEGRINPTDVPLGNDIDLMKMMNERKAK